MHGSKSKFGALGLVLAISPSFDLGIMHHRSWAILWVHFGPWFGFLQPTMNPYGSLVVKRVIGECGFEVEGLFSRAECMGK
ncbi:hypothetical protein AAG906_013256 [Vitis piasezkii]